MCDGAELANWPGTSDSSQTPSSLRSVSAAGVWTLRSFSCFASVLNLSTMYLVYSFWPIVAFLLVPSGGWSFTSIPKKRLAGTGSSMSKCVLDGSCSRTTPGSSAASPAGFSNLWGGAGGEVVFPPLETAASMGQSASTVTVSWRPSTSTNMGVSNSSHFQVNDNL